MKVILGIALMLLGGYGLFWWHEVLWSSGGPDMGRSTFQYVAPYFVTSGFLIVGIYFCTKSVKQLVKSN